MWVLAFHTSWWLIGLGLSDCPLSSSKGQSGEASYLAIHLRSQRQVSQQESLLTHNRSPPKPTGRLLVSRILPLWRVTVGVFYIPSWLSWPTANTLSQKTNWSVIKMVLISWCSLVFYDISTLLGYLMTDLVFRHYFKWIVFRQLNIQTGCNNTFFLHC